MDIQGFIDSIPKDESLTCNHPSLTVEQMQAINSPDDLILIANTFCLHEDDQILKKYEPEYQLFLRINLALNYLSEVREGDLTAPYISHTSVGTPAWRRVAKIAFDAIADLPFVMSTDVSGQHGFCGSPWDEPVRTVDDYVREVLWQRSQENEPCFCGPWDSEWSGQLAHADDEERKAILDSEQTYLAALAAQEAIAQSA